MSKFTKAILLLGYLPSVLILAALLAGNHYFRAGLETKTKFRKTAYESYQEDLKKLDILEDYLETDQRREKMKFWDSHLEEDLLQTLSRNLAGILAEYDEKDIQNTEIGQPTSASPIASQTENDFSRVNLAFEGHYLAIQQTITELEFRMPQLSLESLSISPNVIGGGKGRLPKLKIKLNYLCWHKPKSS